MDTPDIPSQPQALCPRNSIATTVLNPARLTLHTSSLRPHYTNGNGASPASTPLDFALSYTSLKDILPSPTAVNSPTATGANSTCGSAYEISIRNRLVKQAAWAYLQPMSSSPDSSNQHFLLRRLWLRFLASNPITACLRFINVHIIPSLTAAFDCILRAIRVRIPR